MYNPLDGLASVDVLFRSMHPDAKMPVYSSDEAAGADLFAAEKTFVPAGKWCLVKTGVSIELPAGFEAQVRPRSGLALKHGITCLNTPGTIDSDYRGEIGVILMNNGSFAFDVEVGDRIAQLVIAPVWRARFLATGGVVRETNRGEGGFGSTGLSTPSATPVYFNDWADSKEEGMCSDFQIDQSVLTGATVLFASYTYEGYNGSAFVIFERDGTLFEVNGGHCSCYGLEGQWEPEETSTEAIRRRIEGGCWGEIERQESQILAVLDALDAKGK